jgi:hypothetical protein
MASHCRSRTIGWRRRLRAVAARRGEQLGKSGSPLGLPLDTRLPSFDIATGSPEATPCTEGFGSYVSSPAAPIATGRSDPVAGRDLHPQALSAFARRTS